MPTKNYIRFLLSNLIYFYLKFKYRFIRKLNYGLLSDNFDVINSEPFIGTKRFVLNEKECNYIKSLALHKLKRSKVNSSFNNKYSKLRSSSTCTLNFYDNLHTLNLVKKISKLVGIKYKHIPAIEVSHYRVGEFFATHPDAFPKDFILKNLEKNKNIFLQRFVTAICYLNTPEKGGATSFPYFKKRVYPEIGKLLLFQNTGKNSIKQNLKMIHSGDPVQKGDKWIITFWFYDL